MIQQTVPDTAAPRPYTDHLADDVSFHLLGPVEIRRRGRDLTPTAPKCVHLLALLMASPGRIVSVDAICQELWCGGPPRSARSTVQTYVCALRRALGAGTACPDPTAVIVSRATGYVLAVDPRRIDVQEFGRLAADGRRLLDDGHPDAAAGVLRAAVDRWTGPPMLDVDPGPSLMPVQVALAEQYRRTTLLRVEADIRRGAARDVIGDLRALAETDRLDECVRQQLIRVLIDCGRRSEAMAAYRSLRSDLDVELGVHPSDSVEDMYREMLDPQRRVA